MLNEINIDMFIMVPYIWIKSIIHNIKVKSPNVDQMYFKFYKEYFFRNQIVNVVFHV